MSPYFGAAIAPIGAATSLCWGLVSALDVGQKYEGAGKRGPKAKKANRIRHLVLRMKADNPE